MKSLPTIFKSKPSVNSQGLELCKRIMENGFRRQMMTVEEVQSLIKDEIENRWKQSNAHGVDLRTCLVTPVVKRYIDVSTEKAIDLWLVLEEDPEEEKGYKIVFGEANRLFGLATTQMNGPDIFLGFYGTFMETLESM